MNEDLVRNVEGKFGADSAPRISGKIILQSVSTGQGLHFGKLNRPAYDSAFLLWIKDGEIVYYIPFEFMHHAALQMRRFFLHWREDPAIINLKKVNAHKFEITFEFETNV